MLLVSSQGLGCLWSWSKWIFDFLGKLTLPVSHHKLDFFLDQKSKQHDNVLKPLSKIESIQLARTFHMVIYGY